MLQGQINSQLSAEGTIPYNREINFKLAASNERSSSLNCCCSVATKAPVALATKDSSFPKLFGCKSSQDKVHCYSCLQLSGMQAKNCVSSENLVEDKQCQ